MDLETILTAIATSSSIVGCLVIYLAHRIWKDIRSNSRTILLYITVADFVTAVGYLIRLSVGDKSNGRLCVAQSFVTTVSSMVSFFWTCGLALYLNAVQTPNGESGHKVILVFHSLSWSLPVVISLIALFAGVLGDSSHVATGGWCWIKTDRFCSSNSSDSEHLSRTKSVLWMLLTGKFWEIISYILIIIAYVRIWYKVRRQRQQVPVEKSCFVFVLTVSLCLCCMCEPGLTQGLKTCSSPCLNNGETKFYLLTSLNDKIKMEDDTSSTVNRFRSVEKRLILVPKSFIIIRIWGTIRFLRFAMGYCADYQLLRSLQALGDSSQGFVNCVMFCLATQRVALLLRSCCRCPEREEAATPLVPGPNLK